MHPIHGAVLVLALHAASATAADTTAAKAPFGDLAVLDLPQEGVRVRYPADKASKPAARAAYLQAYAEAGVYASQPLRLELGHGLPSTTLTCDSGPSDDPTCRLLLDAEEPRSAIFEAAGKEFVFRADGEIYVFGQSDSMYDHRRLFRYDGKRYAEVAQPFRYVGIEGRTSARLALTAQRGGDARQATLVLEAGTPVTILLNAADGDDAHDQNPDYLVKTREGLVAWAHLPRQPDGSTLVDGLRFDGD